MNRSDALRLARMRAAARTGEAHRQRLAARLTCAEIAAACGVAEMTVWRWEHGKRTPQGEAALKYAKLLEKLGHQAPDQPAEAAQ